MIREIRYIFSQFKLNWFDVNFILTFIGFSVFTSFSTLSSILYRAVALGVALICLFKKVETPVYKGKYCNFFILLLSLFMFRSLPDLLLGEYSSPYYEDARNSALLFGFGIMFIPLLAAIKGFNELHNDTVLFIMLFLLSVTMIAAFTGSAVEVNDGRYALNERRSTLAMGDMGAYLAILGACFLAKFKKDMYPQLSNLLTVVFVGAIILGILVCLKSGSRGPVLSMISGLLFILVSLGKVRTMLILVAAVVIYFSFNVYDFLENYAPVFFNRMSSTIDEGDMSGRDEIFQLAIQNIMDSPIIGKFPLILSQHNALGYHNYYLTIGVGLGIIGFVCIVYYIIMLLVKSLKYRLNIASPFALFIFSMSWFIAIRGLSGINPFTEVVANTTIAFASIMIMQLELNNEL